ncbi:hypothetical protein CHU_0110 [Sporocytophaga myxococcoides]|uniref:Uncharacterized protein n=1 Tax=Sporocytophaga myxococcoides TaxID=153721 RepID=A0A098LCE3_9BACT|nr:hypothetical protein [Sporocytophaga myxococcoides]GAL84661.1 hypothetical protein CHU_0110 [Sporocytophaga myxococcoides]
MKIFSFLLIALVAGFTGKEQKLVQTKLVDGISIGLPKDFYVMTDDDIATKYPSTKKPLAMYTNIDRLVDFGLNVTKSRIPGTDLSVIKDFYKATILQTYDKVTFIQDTILPVNGKRLIAFEFVSVSEGTKKYSFIQYALVNGFIYIFNYTAPENLRAQWQPIVRESMNTIHIEPKKLYDVEPANPKEPVLRGKDAKEVLKDQNARKKKTK